MNKPIKITTDVKKQHTVPRFLLDKFGFGKKGKRRKIHTFDKYDSRVYPQSVFDATTRNKFYNLEGHPERASLEPILGSYETNAAPLIKKIIEKRSIEWLSDRDRFTISTFVAIQRARTHGEHLRIKHAISLVTEKLSDIGATAEQLESEFGLNEVSTSKEIFLKMILDQGDTIDHLSSKSWILYETTDQDPFYISDNPVTLHNDINMGFFSNLGIALKGIQIHLPLSPTLTLALTCPSIALSAIDAEKAVEHCINTAPHMINKFIRPGELQKLGRAYGKGIPMPQSSENVRFLNSLQVRYAEQFIYSGKNDFSLAEEMLKDSESFRSGPRLKVN